MPSSSRGDSFLSQVSTPGMVLVAAVLFAGLAIAPRYKSVRPRPHVPEVAPLAGVVPGLLTEDPLAIVERKQADRRAGARPEGWLAAGLRSALEIGGWSRPKHGTGCAVDGCACCLSEKIRRMPGSVLVLIESLRSGSMAEDQELRVRARQATLYALLHAGYEPALSRRLEYFRPTELSAPLPFEWFDGFGARKGSGPDHVLILWLREDQDRCRPVEQLTEVLARLELDGRSPDRKVCWIGPTDTSKLQQVLSDPTWEQRQALPCVELFSPYATAVSGLERRIEALSDESTIEIHTTIGTDLGLAKVLVAELLERIPDLMPLEQLEEPAHPLVRSVSLLPRGFGPRDREGVVRVAVLAEADTPYGRAWIHNLESARDDLSENQRLAHLRVHERLQFQLFPLVSLIDGAPDGEGDSPDPDYPIGAKQIDYLRRLEGHLETSASDSGGTYSAIGVFCTDVYDTLMILEALRPRFPQALFFTTDLDARYLHERHLPFTRNLIVASHYGLTDDAEPDALTLPEFRSSYQTSVFHSVTAALRGSVPAAGAPRLHEIGAGHAVVLNLPFGAADSPGCLPERSQAAEVARCLVGSTEQAFRYLLDAAWPFGKTVLAATESLVPSRAPPEPGGRPKVAYWIALLSILGLVTLFTFLVHGSGPGRRATLRRRTVLLAGCLWLAIGAWILERASRPSMFAQEPLVFFDGVSVWPAILLRTCVVLFSLLAIVHIQRRMVMLARELRLKHLMLKPLPEQEAADVGFVPGSGETTTLASGFAPVPAESSEREQAPSPWHIARWLVWSDSSVAHPLEDLWMHVERWLASRWTWLRLFLYAVAIYLTASPFYMLSTPPTVPVRGAFAYTLERWTLITSLFAFFMLFASVLELTFLSVRVIIRITDHRVVHLPLLLLRAHARAGLRSGSAAVRKRFGRTTDRVLRLKISRDITRGVENLVYLPMVAVCMLVLARATVFDAWSWPPVLVWTFVVFFALLFACVLVLRRTVKAILARDLASIEEARGRLHVRKVDERILDRDKEQLLGLRGGAFSPLVEHPLVRTSLLPLVTLASTQVMNGELLSTLRGLF